MGFKQLSDLDSETISYIVEVNLVEHRILASLWFHSQWLEVVQEIIDFQIWVKAG